MKKPLSIAPEQGKTTILYPHVGCVLKEIIQVWITVIALITVLLYFSPLIVPHTIKPYTKWIIFLSTTVAILWTAYAFMRYTHTYAKITKEAIIYRKGWVPSQTDTIFWVNIKDVNTYSSVLESLMGSGTVILKVAIRTEIEEIRIEFLPEWRELEEYIRKRIGKLSLHVTQVTYT